MYRVKVSGKATARREWCAIITNDHEALRRILQEAKTVAVVGASRDPAKDAHTVPQYLVEQGYRVIPVNPTAEQLFGERCYPSLRDIPEHELRQIDVLLLFRPSDQVGEHVEAAIALGIPVIWMQEGIRNEEWARRAEAAGLRVVQDTCMRTAHLVLVKAAANPGGG